MHSLRQHRCISALDRKPIAVLGHQPRQSYRRLTTAAAEPTEHLKDQSVKLFAFSVYIVALAVSLALSATVRAQTGPSRADQARKEAEVIWYGSLTGGTIVGRVIKTFEDKYPPIKVKYLRMGGAGLIERIRSEARAGRFLWDVATAEYVQFFQLPKHVAFAKYFTPEFQQFAPAHRDPNGAWISLYGAIATIAWNTQMVKSAEAPRDWKNLLEPKWKGKKIGLPAEAYQWYGGMVTYMGDKAGREYMQALAGQDPQTQQGYTNTSNLLVAGEFPIAIIRAHRIELARAKGAPVDWSAEANPIVYSIHPVGILEKAPHPSAARLFYDFLASVEGQTLFTEEGFTSSHDGVKARFPRASLDRIKFPAPPDAKVSERIETWLKEYPQTFHIAAGRS
jgi:iron(III) transport system substrate-binding protein